MVPEKVILGIDPGTQVFGWGVIGVTGGRASYISMGVTNLKGKIDHFSKLSAIFKEVDNLIERFSPDELAIEAPFYGKNIQSMLKLGRAQGAAIAAALNRNMQVFEYAPRKVKMSITGKGASSKEQVALIISKILSVKDLPETLDATDGLAVALCHFLVSSVPGSAGALRVKGRSSAGWDSFVKSNPNRIKKS